MSKRQIVFRRRSFAKTPIGVINSCQSSLTSQTLGTVSYEDHKKALLKNNCLAREVSSCKEEIRALKSEILSLKAKQLHSNYYYQAFENNSVLLFQLNDRFNGLKTKYEDFGSDLVVCEEALAGGLNQLYCHFPDIVERIGQNGQYMNEIPISLPSTSEITGEKVRIEANKYSLSAQERQSRRGLSLEKIKSDFHVFSDLSTIIEQSRDKTSSSMNSGRDSLSRISGHFDGKTSVIPSQTRSSLSSHQPIVSTIAEVNSDAEIVDQNQLISAKVSNKSDSSRPKSRVVSKPFINSINTKRHTRSRTAKKSSNVYDESDKENISPKDNYRFSLDFQALQNTSSPIQSYETETDSVIPVMKGREKAKKKTEFQKKVIKRTQKRTQTTNESKTENETKDKADSKGKKAVKSNEPENDLMRRLSVYDFAGEENRAQPESKPKKASKPRRARNKP